METQTAADRSKTISTGFLDGARKNYPREVEYVLVAIALALITGLEIATYAAPGFPLWSWGEKTGLVLFLLLLMAVKFWTVAYFFMHLKFDKPILTRLFYSGVILAIAVYVAVMAMMHGFKAGQH
ncbi:MAG TPA: cytochrome C oxidase subunit IV family protein [Acidimicrobiales bacterium]